MMRKMRKTKYLHREKVKVAGIKNSWRKKMLKSRKIRVKATPPFVFLQILQFQVLRVTTLLGWRIW